MTHVLHFYQEEELVKHNLPVQTCLEMKFQGKQMVRCLDFAKHRRRLAFDICQEDIAAGIFCVLTESETHFTIWRERPPEPQESEHDGDFQTPLPVGPSQSLSSREQEISSPQLEELQAAYMLSPISKVCDVGANSVLPPIDDGNEILEISTQTLHLKNQSALSIDPIQELGFSPTIEDFPQSSRSIFLSRLNQELAQYIGPIADFIINDLLAKKPNIQPQQLIEEIVAEVPDSKEADNIQKALEYLIHQLQETI